MILTKDAPITPLSHAVVTVTASQPLPDVPEGARGFYVQNIGLGEDVWVTFDESEAAVDSAIKLECLNLRQYDVDPFKVRVFAASPCKFSVSYFR